jgi:iron(III) transport system permease protein
VATVTETLAHRRAPAGRRDLLPALMVGAATLACVAVASLLVVIFWLSFTDGTPGMELEYTLENFSDMFLDKVTYLVIGNTLGFAATTLCVALAIGLPMAWLIERTNFPGKRVVFTLFTVALLLPGFSVALGWLFLLNPRVGAINHLFMGLFGLSEAPFNVSTIFGMGMVEGLSLTPVIFIMTSVVFRSMDASLEEAARMGGATLFETMRRITLPLAWPGILAASIYVFAIGFAAFDVPAILGMSNRIYTFSTYVYHNINPDGGLPEYGAVAALSMFMLSLAVLMTLWYARVQRQAPRYAIVTGKAYRPVIVRLGRFKWLAIAFVVAYFTLAQLLPVLMLIWASVLPYLQPVSAAAFDSLTWKNYTDLQPDVLVLGMRNTGVLMLLVPTIAVTLAVGISWVVLRSKLRGRAVFEFFAFLPHTIPPIVFSVAAWLLALFVLAEVLPLYGTIWILVLVYVVQRISYCTRMTNTAMIQVHKELEESATIFGAPTAGVMRRVLLPLLAPAMAYAWIWTALLAYRELTLPVVLTTSGNQTLSMVVWGLVQTSAFGPASAVALIMVGLMIPILILYWTVARRTGIAPSG